MGVFDKETLQAIQYFGWGNFIGVSIIGASVVIAIPRIVDLYLQNTNNNDESCV